ncbi:TPA: TrkH family potassium uptake protein [Enterococcus faecium]|uniref:TrkH family potassium uptake protein n=1 Tax=Enterococcus faecium TaxID=1352 RepID=UPI0009BEF424|nr:TrkH family potassium uptake protein [Enterococcus faecium]EGP5243712.1 TrkH family potassium uptake protein [Enterococcus faecium]EJC3745896.1 TrkH family potassium uptake protein [Enterococcus faecium]EME3567247.1 TrkH family potassium uptake protein [Enterococcus faecium]MBD9898671.1 TrkH family potassium uptake protein [Enterococcus faecium]MBE9893103.1 TrkH family potassium uptake protein [Enterococcus faecium]
MHVDLFFRRLQRRGQKFAANHFSSIQIIVFYYILMTVLSLVLFYMPIFREPDSHVSFVDMLFMAISTVSVTGLSTFDINSVFNDNGIILLEILFQVGGLGIMMISTAFVIFSKRRITLKQRQLIMTDMNQPRLSGIVRLIRITFAILIWFQLLFGTFFSIYFYYRGYFDRWRDAVFYGFYQAISAVTNSGFDVTGDSIKPFAHDYFFLILIMFLIFVGGIGFPVLMECREWLLYKRSNAKLPFRFSLFTKLAVLAFVILFVSGTVLIYLLEKDHLFQDSNMSVKWINSMFYSITTRNAGLQIHDLGDFQITTLIIFSLLMFIGCSPSSVGGGIRTTTVAIIGLYLYSFLKSEDNINIFGRRIDQDDVRKSVVVFMLSLGMCFFCIVFLSATEEQTLISIIIEVTSAFGTTGLSLGITGDLSVVGKITIAALMFIGRIGMLYTLMLFIPKETRDLGYEYPSEKIIIG